MKVNTRIKVPDSTIGKVFDSVSQKINKRIENKGDLCHASTHESLGIITEEFWEYVEAVKANDNEEIIHELIDIAVGCIFAIASMNEIDRLKLRD